MCADIIKIHNLGGGGEKQREEIQYFWIKPERTVHIKNKTINKNIKLQQDWMIGGSSLGRG